MLILEELGKRYPASHFNLRQEDSVILDLTEAGNRRLTDVMDPRSEYAPQYSQQERLRHAAIAIVVGAVVWVVGQWWAFPALKEFVQTAHCRTVLGIPGTTALTYGIFVGLPLVVAMTIAIVTVPGALRALKSQQYPPPGAKTYRPVKVQRGRQAKKLVSMVLSLPVAVIFLALWGRIQAAELTRSVKSPSSYAECRAPRIEPPGPE